MSLGEKVKRPFDPLHVELALLRHRRLLPFFNIRSPEIRALSTGLNGLLVCSVPSNTYVAREEECKDKCGLGREEHDSGICKLERVDRSM